jgi:hypothetical protein
MNTLHLCLFNHRTVLQTTRQLNLVSRYIADAYGIDSLLHQLKSVAR